jgi:hypothetical protein
LIVADCKVTSRISEFRPLRYEHPFLPTSNTSLVSDWVLIHNSQSTFPLFVALTTHPKAHLPPWTTQALASQRLYLHPTFFHGIFCPGYVPERAWPHQLPARPAPLPACSTEKLKSFEPHFSTSHPPPNTISRGLSRASSTLLGPRRLFASTRGSAQSNARPLSDSSPRVAL